MRYAAAHTVENVLHTGDDEPVGVVGKKLTGKPFITGLPFIRGAFHKWLTHKDIQGMKTARGGMSLIIFQNLFSELLRHVMQRTGAENNVEFAFQPEVKHISLKKIHFDSTLIGKPFCLFKTGICCIKRRYVITVPCKKDGVLSFSAGHIKQSKRFDRRTELHDFIAHIGRAYAPVVAVGFITFFIIGNFSLLGRISQKGIYAAMEYICQNRQCRDIRYGIPSFP